MSVADRLSDAIGSDGTGTDSRIGSGGVAEPEPVLDVAAGGATGGLATGGFFLPHAPTIISATIATVTRCRLCFIVSVRSFYLYPFYPLPFPLSLSPFPFRGVTGTNSDTDSSPSA